MTAATEPAGPAAGARPSPGGVGPVTAVVELGLRACAAYGRPDLGDRLAAARQRLADPAIHVVVAGDFKQGKSSLVNALLGATVCPVDDDIATALPTYVRFGAEVSAELLYPGEPPRREPIPIDDIRQYVIEPSADGRGTRGSSAGTADPPASGDRPVGVVVAIPRKMLSPGLVVVDTPGVGGLGSPYAAASLTAVSMADAVLFVTDASQELTAAEMEFLRRAHEMCSTVLCVVTKTDFYPAWRTIRELDEQHLRATLDLPVLAASAALRARAVRTNDPALNAESGFTDLVSFVTDRVTGDAAARIAHEAAAEVAAVCQQIEAQFEAERTVLADPDSGKRVVGELTAVKQQVEALRSASAKWSQTLNDGVADLTSDIDHDLRSRIRRILQEADQLIDDLDPADAWSEIEAWLESEVSDELVANYALLRLQADTLSNDVWRHFREAAGQVFDQLAVYSPTDLLARAQVDPRLDLTKMGVGKQAMTALRSSYGGILMFTMLSSMAGVALGPLAVGIGLVMGASGLRAEKKRQLGQRRSQAKNAVRRYLDEVSFTVTKDSRDTLRRIQRQLRDHYSTRAEELNRSNAQALHAATDAAGRSQADRERRLRDINSELDRIRALREQALAVAG